jgi:hypothetical protein
MGAIMRYTIEQLNAARAAKRERSNRGESVGNHGIRQLTAAEQRECDPTGFDLIAAKIAYWRREVEARHLARLYELKAMASGDSYEIPF